MSDKTTSAVTEPRTPKVDVLNRLLDVFTLEQLTMVADVFCRIQARAIERDNEQSVELVFNRRGFFRHCNASDNITIPAPKGCMPE